jgi:hypothetical protein
MKMSSVKVELFYVDGQKRKTDRQTDGRIDMHDEAISHFPQLGERAQMSLLTDPKLTSYVKARQ